MKQLKLLWLPLFLYMFFLSYTDVNAQSKLPKKVGSNSNIITEAMKLTKGGHFIDSEYKVTIPIDGFVNMTLQETYPTTGLGLKATLEVIPFGQKGNTIILFIEGKGEIPDLHASWSGRNVHLAPGKTDGLDALAVVRNNTITCGGLAFVEGKWLALFNNSDNAVMNSTLKRGLSRADVENEISQLKGSQFKYTRKSGNLDVYTCYWLGSKDYYDIRKGPSTVIKNDKPWADFYFDSNGKLVKWLYLF